MSSVINIHTNVFRLIHNRSYTRPARKTIGQKHNRSHTPPSDTHPVRSTTRHAAGVWLLLCSSGRESEPTPEREKRRQSNRDKVKGNALRGRETREGCGLQVLLQQSSCCCLFAAKLLSPTAWRRLKVRSLVTN